MSRPLESSEPSLFNKEGEGEDTISEAEKERMRQAIDGPGVEGEGDEEIANLAERRRGSESPAAAKDSFALFQPA